MSDTTRPMLPHDASDQDAVPGGRLVSRRVHHKRCGLRRGGVCSCCPKVVHIRPEYARRFERVSHERA